MKEATGELSMTVIVIIGAIAIVAILTWLGPRIGEYVQDKWNTIERSDARCGYGEKWDAVNGKCVSAT